MNLTTLSQIKTSRLKAGETWSCGDSHVSSSAALVLSWWSERDDGNHHSVKLQGKVVSPPPPDSMISWPDRWPWRSTVLFSQHGAPALQRAHRFTHEPTQEPQRLGTDSGVMKTARNVFKKSKMCRPHIYSQSEGFTELHLITSVRKDALEGDTVSTVG